MIEQKIVNVNGTDYMLTQFGGLQGLKLGKQLIKLIGPAFSSLQSEGGIAKALELLFDSLDDNTEKLIVDLVSGASKNGVAINFNLEFAGQYDTLFLLVKEIVEFNYGSVFTLLGSNAQ